MSHQTEAGGIMIVAEHSELDVITVLGHHTTSAKRPLHAINYLSHYGKQFGDGFVVEPHAVIDWDALEHGDDLHASRNHGARRAQAS